MLRFTPDCWQRFAMIVFPWTGYESANRRSYCNTRAASRVPRSGRPAEFGSRKPHGYLDSQHEQACCRSTGSRSGGGIAVFLGNEEKVFVIYVDQSVGVAIAMFMQGTQRERPLTHDLLANVLRALEAKIDRVIVNDLKHGTYFARLVLSAENELNQKKIIVIDARPSDCIAMAIQQSAPIYVSADIWDAVEDMTETLRKMQEEGPPAEESDDQAQS